MRLLTAWWHERRHRHAERAYYGDCPHCGHDWREHHPTDHCGECRYEIEHQETEAPAEPCNAQAAGHYWS